MKKVELKVLRKVLLMTAILSSSITSVIIVVKTHSMSWEAVVLLGSMAYVLIRIPYRIVKKWVFEQAVRDLEAEKICLR